MAQSCKVFQSYTNDSFICWVSKMSNKLEDIFLKNVKTFRITYRRMYVVPCKYWKRQKVF